MIKNPGKSNPSCEPFPKWDDRPSSKPQWLTGSMRQLSSKYHPGFPLFGIFFGLMKCYEYLQTWWTCYSWIGDVNCPDLLIFDEIVQKIPCFFSWCLHFSLLPDEGKFTGPPWLWTEKTGFYDVLRLNFPNYPLVNSHITMGKITIFNGKTHYFYGHFQ
jgi:hypothetical protein